jgi:L-threonylcarbamoyladenylate synthase
VAQALLKALMDCRAALAMTVNSSESVIARSEATRQSMPSRVWGLAAPSANQFGRVSPTTAAHVQGEFGGDLLVLDGGACSVGIESTIIDCTRGAPVLLRPGAITPEQVQAVCGQKVLSIDDLLTHETPAPKASGTLDSHYAPKAQVRLMTAQDLQTSLDLLGTGTSDKASKGGYLVATYSRAILKTANDQVLCRRMPDDVAAAAQQLFAVLRAFDAQGVKLIWIESPPASMEWDGVRDRLQRASAG